MPKWFGHQFETLQNLVFLVFLLFFFSVVVVVVVDDDDDVFMQFSRCLSLSLIIDLFINLFKMLSAHDKWRNSKRRI